MQTQKTMYDNLLQKPDDEERRISQYISLLDVVLRANVCLELDKDEGNSNRDTN